MRRRRRAEAAGPEAVELAALADGSLSADRRAMLELKIAASPELADRLAEQERAVAFARNAAADVAAPAALRARVGTQQHARRAPMSRRIAVIGAATAVVLAVVIGIGVFRSGTSAERFRAALAPTGLEPSARGEATLTKTSSGWRIAIDATGLPRRDGPNFYEAWLRNAAGVLVPIGTFNEGRHVTLWAGVSPKDFPTLTITREQADGDQTSSGAKVLVGTAGTGG
jgi:hypothetical protein